MIPRGRLSQRGQSFVEFAIILPVLLLLVMAALDLGRVFLAAVTVNNTARVGARYAASYPEAWGGTPDAARQAEYQTQISAEWADIDCDRQSPVPDPAFGGSMEIGQPVSVTLQCTFHVLTPIISEILGNTITLTGFADIPITSCAGTAATPGSGTEACVAAPTPAPIPTPCPQGTPTLTAVPATQSGLAGTALNYTVTYTNNDDATCAPRAVALSATVSTNGFTTSFSPASLSVAGGGTSATSTLTVTSAGSTSNGARTVTISATGATNTSVIYVVQSCNTAPTVSTVPVTQTGIAGSALAYTVTVTNPDVSVCGPRTFNLTANFAGNSSGWLSSFSPASLTIAAGASGSSTMTITSPVTGSGSKDVTASASGTAGNAVTYVVQPCNQAPTVAAAPLTQSGLVGSALAYTVTITNPDAPACGSRTWTMGATFQGGSSAGWTATFSPTTVALAGGASGTTTMTVTSPAGASGSKNVTATATNAGVTTNANPVAYVIVTCTQAPTVSASPASRSGPAGSARTWTVTVTNNDPSGCGSKTFTLGATIQNPNAGWSSSFAPPSLTLAAQAGGTSTMTITSPAGGSGTKNITPTATTGGVTTNGIAVSFVIQPCTTNPPTFTTVAPVTQTGFPGDTKTFTVNILNNDSASCSDRTFLFTTAMNPPSGNWTVSTPGALTLSPGASGTRNVNVTPDNSVSAGTYDIDVTTAAITVTFHYTVMTPTPSPTPSPTPTPAPPTAKFTCSPTTVATLTDVTCTDNSTGTITSWSWNWGDGSPPDTTANATHQYSATGAYDVTLTINGPYGGDILPKTGYITVQ